MHFLVSYYIAHLKKTASADALHLSPCRSFSLTTKFSFYNDNFYAKINYLIKDFIKQDYFSQCPGEIESIEWIPLPECIKMITSGEIVDSFTIIALLAYSNLELNN